MTFFLGLMVLSPLALARVQLGRGRLRDCRRHEIIEGNFAIITLNRSEILTSHRDFHIAYLEISATISRIRAIRSSRYLNQRRGAQRQSGPCLKLIERFFDRFLALLGHDWPPFLKNTYFPEKQKLILIYSHHLLFCKRSSSHTKPPRFSSGNMILIILKLTKKTEFVNKKSADCINPHLS
jgi:hypothetical protein